MKKKPYVFSDYHHAALFYSFILLFEKRFGGKVFRPIGEDWYTRGLWKLRDHPDTIKQYLRLNSPVNNRVSRSIPIEGSNHFIYECKNISGFTTKAVTLNGFFQLPIDIVIASIPSHIEPFQHLCRLHPNEPKFIYQIGNSWSVESGLTPNVMASTLINKVQDNIHLISYHQEFDLNVFYPDFSEPAQNIYSFMNGFQTIDDFASDWRLFQNVEASMPDWNFKSHGGACRDGRVYRIDEVACHMRKARFIWHTKKDGDGYGHVIYNSAAAARPMIVKTKYYENQLGKELMKDCETCIAIDGLSLQEIVNKILYYSDEQRYRYLCKNISENFKSIVDFDAEAKELETFIDGLQ